MMRFVWRYLPVFFIWLIGLSVLNNALHHISPPVQSVRLLAFLPLGVSLVLLLYACRKEYGDEGAMRPFIPWAAGMTLLYCAPFMHSLSMPLALGDQKLIYELSALAQFALMVAHARTWFRPWDWAWVFGATLLFGMILENGGIILGVFSEPGFLLYLPGLPAPLATALGWANVLYCAFFAVERVLPPLAPLGKGFVCALIGLSLDIPFDPVATRLGWWVWEASLNAKVWDVPVINFVAWFWAIFPYGVVYYAVRENGKCGEGKKVGWFVAGFPAILLVEFLGVAATLSLAGDRAGLAVIQRLFSVLGLP
jgi:hypothetical protein